MKESKFRFYDKEKNKLHYGINSLIQDYQEFIESDTATLLEDILRGDTYDDIIVQQYTGLKDKNGKEIYNGDIVKYENWTFPEFKGTWTIKWNAYMWDMVRNFEPRFKGDKNEGSFETEQFLFNKHENLEIIGNIFENPELLK